MYNDNLDPDMQITCEEAIASLIFERRGDDVLSEEECADLGRDILKFVLQQFRPDLITEKE